MKKKLTRIIAISFAFIVLLTNTVNVFANTPGTEERSVNVTNGVQWLMNAVQDAKVGDEEALVTLLRSGDIKGDHEYVTKYMASLTDFIKGGGLETQSYERTAWQAVLILLARNNLTIEAPEVIKALADNGGIVKEGLDAMHIALLATSGKVAQDAAGSAYSAEALLSAYVAKQNEDGSFGGESDDKLLQTAKAMQVLAIYNNGHEAANASYVKAQGWFWKNLKPKENISPETLAYCYMATMTYGGNEDITVENTKAVQDKLIAMQKEDGSFTQGNDAKRVNAICTMAIVSKQRAREGKPSALNLMGIILSQPTPGDDQGKGYLDYDISLPSLRPSGDNKDLDAQVVRMLLIIALIVISLIIITVLWLEYGIVKKKNDVTTQADEDMDDDLLPGDDKEHANGDGTGDAETEPEFVTADEWKAAATVSAGAAAAAPEQKAEEQAQAIEKQAEAIAGDEKQQDAVPVAAAVSAEPKQTDDKNADAKAEPASQPNEKLPEAEKVFTADEIAKIVLREGSVTPTNTENNEEQK